MQGMDRVYKRLDIALCSASWRTRFEEVVVMVLTRTNSDHHPLLIKLQGVHSTLENKPSIFEASWIRHACFPELLSSMWDTSNPLLQNMQSLTKMPPSWNRSVFGKIHFRKRSLLARLNGI